MAVVAVFYRLHDEVAGLGETAKEDKGLGTTECGKVGTSRSQHFARKVIDTLGQLIALSSCKTHFKRSDLCRLKLTQQARCVAHRKKLTGRTGNACSRTIGLKAPCATATAGATVLAAHHRHMAQLAGKTVGAVNHLTVDHDARADTRAQRDVDKVLHATGHTIGHFAQSGRIGIIGKCHGNTAQPLGEHLGQRHHTIVSPHQVGCILYRSAVEVAIGSTDAHSLDVVNASHSIDDGDEGLYSLVHVVFNLVVALCFDGSGSLDFPSGINDTKHGVGTSQVQSDHIRF